MIIKYILFEQHFITLLQGTIWLHEFKVKDWLQEEAKDPGGNGAERAIFTPILAMMMLLVLIAALI
jgi:hypothetical protein